MTTRLPFLGSFILLVAVVGLVTLRARQTSQIHPTSGSGGPITIAVLADNFTGNERDDFNEAAQNLLIYGLFDDPLFGSRKDAFTITTVFHPVPPTRKSRYGFVIGNDASSNCSLLWDQDGKDTAALVEDDAAPTGANFVVVIGNYDYNFGCQNDNWAYISTGTVGLRVVHHEVAHLVFGLMDEFALPARLTTTYPDGPVELSTKNCSTRLTSPHWGSDPAVLRPECDLYGVGIIHGHQNCTMGRHDPKEFCPVCTKIIAREIDCKLGRCERASPGSLPRVPVSGAGLMVEAAQPGQPTSPAPSALRLMIRLSAERFSPVRVVRATDAPTRPQTENRRLGDFVYHVTEGATTLAFGVIPGNPFQTRAYRGGVMQHRADEDASTAIMIPIIGLDRETARKGSRKIEIAIYRIPRSIPNETITVELVTGLFAKDPTLRHAVLSAKELQEGINALK
jgi:hypothetical protein